MAQSTVTQIEKLEKVYAANPGSRVFVHLAEAYRRAGDFGKAHEVLAQGLRRHREYPSGLVVLAKVYSDQGEDVKAEAVWRNVIRLDPENVVALRALGDITESSGRKEEARDFYRRVVRLENAEPGDDAEDAYELDATGDAGPGMEEPAADGAAAPLPSVLPPPPASLPPVRESYEPDAPPDPGTDEALPVRQPTPAAVPAPTETGPPFPRGVAEPATSAAEMGVEGANAAPGRGTGERPSLPAPAIPAAVAQPPEAPRAQPAVVGRDAPAPPRVNGGSPTHSEETGALAELLVRLLEQDGTVFHAHSSLRRLLARALARELALTPPQLDTLDLAALLGGLGELRPGIPGAPATPVVTVQLLRGVTLPSGVRGTIAHQHECWDGTGPHGLRGERTPLLARILAVARAGAALLAATPDLAAAAEELERHAGAAFDPRVVSALRRVIAHRERHGIGYFWGGRIAVAHPQERRALELAARLHGYGYTVEAIRGAQGLRERLRGGAPHALVLAAELPDADTAVLVRNLKAAPKLRGVPVVVIDVGETERRVALLAAGADLCLGPEVGFTEFKASLDALLRRSEAGAVRTRSSPPSHPPAGPYR